MPLRPVTIDEGLIGRHLPWDLYTVSGVLVAGAGMLVGTREQLARLTERPLFRQIDGERDEPRLSLRIDTLVRHYPTVLKVAGTSHLEPLIRLMAGEIASLADLDHDATLGLLRLLPEVDPAARHCLITALLALDMARMLMPPDSPLIESTVCAALTMNLGAMPLHALMTTQHQPPDKTQRESIAQHPEDSLSRLQAGGLNDPDWLEAVRQHHENLDGSGYPRGLRGDDIGTPARILRLADYFVAKIRRRRYRQAETTRSAFRHIFGDERGRLDSHLALLLLRRLGLLPPGTLMRLASQEIAVVVRKQGSGESAGKVVVFLGPNGRPLKKPMERNTNQTEFSVLNVTEVEPRWPEVDWPALWGY